MINNSPEHIRSRRDRNTLRIVGAGTIAFGIWSLVKVFTVLFIRRNEIITAMYEDAQEKGLDVTEISPSLLFKMMLIMAMTMLIFDIASRLIVGLSAIYEGNGRNMRFPYVILTCIMMLINISNIITLLTGTQEDAGILTEVFNNDSMLSSVLIELTSFIMLLEMTIASVRIRRINRQERKKRA